MEDLISIFGKNMLVLNPEKTADEYRWSSTARGETTLRGVCIGVCSQKVRANYPDKMGVSFIFGRTLSPPRKSIKILILLDCMVDKLASAPHSTPHNFSDTNKFVRADPESFPVKILFRTGQFPGL
jgi:hypothetical protein